MVPANAAGGESNRLPRPCHGTVEMTAAAGMCSPRTRTPVTRSPATSTFAGAFTRTSCPRASSHARAGSA